jgi:hypothetical protein
VSEHVTDYGSDDEDDGDDDDYDDDDCDKNCIKDARTNQIGSPIFYMSQVIGSISRKLTNFVCQLVVLKV